MKPSLLPTASLNFSLYLVLLKSRPYPTISVQLPSQ